MVSFLRRCLDEELCRELNLFEFIKENRDYVVSEVSDEKGWKKVRDTLVTSVGMNGIPVIEVKKIGSENVLHLEQEWDGRELFIEYAHQTLKYVARLWGHPVRLRIRSKGTYQLLESHGE